MEALLSQLMAALSQQAGLGGWMAAVGGLGVLLTFSIRLYKLAFPGRFEGLPTVAQLLIVFGAAALGTFVVAVAAKVAAGIVLGTVVGELIIAALGAGVAAVLAHHGPRPLGQSIDAASLAKDPAYQPGLLRKAGSLVIDLPKLPPAKPKPQPSAS